MGAYPHCDGVAGVNLRRHLWPGDRRRWTRGCVAGAWRDLTADGESRHRDTVRGRGRCPDRAIRPDSAGDHLEMEEAPVLTSLAGSRGPAPFWSVMRTPCRKLTGTVSGPVFPCGSGGRELLELICTACCCN
ncbi:hypothetical protein NDU88_006639 [Pleurodeles waltl]|uniref:Uncharacterized protein n=1 Tax=Pleurodeles waltl TaxID=8319 RepID=A0AAV7VQ80_PLEWA|nr:hypothetical protein NDU88_006639 [Pleurodeles waltl]